MIRVRLPRLFGSIVSYPDGARAFVEEHVLVVKDREGRALAIYAPGEWCSSERVTP